MIQFNCHCSYRFEVPEDQAGGLIQCPTCHRLNDIPTLSDVANLEDGGIYKLDDVPGNPHQSFQEAHRIYTREHVDETTGEEIDLRPSADDILASGTTAIPIADEVLAAPKYDPETGELIEALDIRKEQRKAVPIDPSKIPVARRALNYANSDAETPVESLGGIVRAVFQPMNLFVLLFVLVHHLILYIVSVVSLAGFFFMVPVAFIVLILLLSHYGCVVDETGPTKSDELPRPLRNLSWHDDLWGPGFRIVLGLFVCYMPAWIMHRFGVTGNFVGVALVLTWVVCMSVFLPAVWMITLTSGALENLRPDRVVGTMKEMGASYVALLLLTILSIGVYLVGNFFTFAALASTFAPGLKQPVILSAIGLPVLVAGISLVHITAWYMGLQYRRCHHIFPWVLQRHVSTRKDTARILEARRREAQKQKQLQQNRPDRDQRLNELRQPPPPPPARRA